MKRMRFAGGLAAVLVMLLCAPDIGLAASIKGKVVFGGAVPAQKKVDVTIDQYLCGNEKDPPTTCSCPRTRRSATRSCGSRTPPPGAAAAARTEKVEMDQKGCTFVPADRGRPGRRHGGFPQQRPPAAQHPRDAEAQRVVQPHAADGPDDPGHLRRARDRAHQLRPPLLDGRLGGRGGAPLLCGHRRRRALRLRQAAAGPLQAAGLARAPGHGAGERHRRRPAAGASPSR